MIRLEYIDTKSQKADILTKPLPGPAHATCVREMGLARPRKDEESSLGFYTVEENESSRPSRERQGDNGWRPVA